MSAIEAGQEGRCGLCDGWIYIGDFIVIFEDLWCHVECEEAV